LDAILPALVSAAPQLGVAGVLLLLLGLTLRTSSQDRADYRTQLADAAKRHTEELDELKSDIKELRKEIDDLNAKLDEERAARRRAEDMAAEAQRKRGRAAS
jgi:cell division protein FtsB